MLCSMYTASQSMPLADCCEIQTGYTARERLEPAVDGIRAVQLRDLASEGGIDITALQRVAIADPADRYLVAAGDVVFRSRGDHNIAVAMDDAFDEPAVAMSPLFILRPDTRMIVADYLAWAINQPDAQRQIDAAARGTNMRMVPKSALDALLIEVPDLETQRHVVAIDRLAMRERQLLIDLAQARGKLTNQMLAACVRRGQSRHSERSAR